MRNLLILLLGMLSITVSAQEIYRWTDKDGKLHFTDTPPPPTESKNITSKAYKTNPAESDDTPYAVREAMKKNPVTLYANDCGDNCSNARALLAKRGIPFTDKNPQSDAAALAAFKVVNSSLSVPFLLVGTSSFSGFDESQWQALLDAAGYPRTSPGLKPKASKPAAAPDNAATPAAPAPAP